MYARQGLDKAIGAFYTVLFGGILYIIKKSYQKRVAGSLVEGGGHGDAYYQVNYGKENECLSIHHGGCECGRIQFQVKSPKEIQAFDSADRMTKKKGRYPQLVVPNNRLEIRKESAAISVYASKDGVNHSFCSKCGIPLFHKNCSAPHMVHVNVYCLDQKNITQLKVIFLPNNAMLFPPNPLSFVSTNPIRRFESKQYIENEVKEEKQKPKEKENETTEKDGTLLMSLALLSRLQPQRETQRESTKEVQDESVKSRTKNNNAFPTYASEMRAYNMLHTPRGSMTSAVAKPISLAATSPANSSTDYTISNQDENEEIALPEDDMEKLVMMRRHLLAYCE